MKVIRKFDLDGVKLSKDGIVKLMNLFSLTTETMIDISMEHNQKLENMTVQEFIEKDFNNIIIDNIYLHSHNYDESRYYYLKLESYIFTEKYIISIESENEIEINDLENKLK